MVKENIHLQMTTYMKVNTNKIINMVKEKKHIQMEKCMKVYSKMIGGIKENIYIQMV